MALDLISQVSDVIIYPAAIVSNIIRMIGQTLMAFTKPGTYGA